MTSTRIYNVYLHFVTTLRMFAIFRYELKVVTANDAPKIFDLMRANFFTDVPIIGPVALEDKPRLLSAQWLAQVIHSREFILNFMVPGSNDNIMAVESKTGDIGGEQQQ